MTKGPKFQITNSEGIKIKITRIEMQIHKIVIEEIEGLI